MTHAERDGIHVLRYFGRVNYMSAPAIQRFLDDLLEEGPLSGLVFDLSDAESLDSTNLGLLARVNERVRESSNTATMIVSRNGDITDVLLSMGFDQSFELITEPGVIAPSDPAPDPLQRKSGNTGAGNDPATANRAQAHGTLAGGADGTPGTVADSEAPPPSQVELHRTMLEAHRALVRLSDAGRLQFQDVVACLESERPSR